MSIFSFLSGGPAREFKGVDINKEDFKIKDADKMFGQTQSQFEQQAQRQQQLAGRSDTLMNQLSQAAAGQGPSITEQQLKQAQERSLAQQLAAVQAQRSGNPVALQRQALRQQSEQASSIAAQASQGRLQEQLAARQQLGGMIGQEGQLVGNLTQQYLQMGMGLRQAEQQALADFNRLRVQQETGLAAAQASADASQRGAFSNVLGGIISAGGALGASAIKGKA